jgi:hypothetical protein
MLGTNIGKFQTRKRSGVFCRSRWPAAIDRDRDRCEKRVFSRHLYIKCIILPRQARDKHRESTQKKDRLIAGSCLRELSAEPCMHVWPFLRLSAQCFDKTSMSPWFSRELCHPFDTEIVDWVDAANPGTPLSPLL